MFNAKIKATPFVVIAMITVLLLGVQPVHAQKKVGVSIGDIAMDNIEPPVKFSIISDLEVGWCDVLNPDYSLYPNDKDFMKLKIAPSTNISLGVAEVSVRITPGFYFKMGARIDWYNYVFANQITLVDDGVMIHPSAITDATDFTKSKLATTYIGIPIRFVFGSPRKLSFGVEGSASYLVESHTKYKSPVYKDKGIQHLNKYQLMAGASISFKGIGVYGRYAFSPMFKSNEGPAGCNGLYFGICLGM